MLQTFVRQQRRAAILCTLILILGFWTSAFAQLDYDTYDIYQNAPGVDRLLVGSIYVPQRAPGAELYVEYWVLFPGYTYPSEMNPVATEIVPSAGYHYTSLLDFLENVPWVQGSSRFVTILALDTGNLPGRVPSIADSHR